MREIVGGRTIELDTDAFAARRDRYERLVLDVGTGDGKHVVAHARAHPDTLVVGVDASPDAMRRTSARAAAKPARGGVPNAMFVWAAAERLPGELTDVDAVHVLMPWGSLLRAVAHPVRDVLAGLAATARPAGELLITLNLHAWRPPVPEVGETPEPTPVSIMTAAWPDYAAAGWHLDAAQHPGAGELAELGTSWTRRLASSRDDLDVLMITGHRTP